VFGLSDPRVRFGVESCLKACQLGQAVQKELAGQGIDKSDGSPVTIADFGIQALVAHSLGQYFPEDILVAEESAEMLRNPDERLLLDQITGFVERWDPDATPDNVCDWIDRGNGEPGRQFWTLDPVDGTKGFIRGDQYAVALAYLREGAVQIGILGCPNLRLRGVTSDEAGVLLVAVRGEGCWARRLVGDSDFLPISVSARDSAREAVLLRSYEVAHTHAGKTSRLAVALGIQAEPQALDSQAKYALLAAGEGDIMIRLLSPKSPNYREKIWDQAAGALVVTEAGGRITDIEGRDLDFTTGVCLENNKGIVASNGYLHEAVLDGIKSLTK